jgi:DNA-binding XRE family transcriptional regulator
MRERTQIAQLRLDAMMTQEMLAEMLNVDPRTVRRWEAGETQPPPEIMARLAAARPACTVSAAIVSIIEITGDMMLLFNREHRLVMSSTAHGRALGYAAPTWVGRRAEDTMPRSIAEMWAQFGGVEKFFTDNVKTMEYCGLYDGISTAADKTTTGQPLAMLIRTTRVDGIDSAAYRLTHIREVPLSLYVPGPPKLTYL